MQNTKKWIQISYLLLSAIVWVFFYYVSDTVWDLVRLPVPADWFIQPPQIIAFAAAIAVFVTLSRVGKINLFANEVATELAKVTWPERRETTLSAVVISVMIAICAVILFGFDSIWGTVVKTLY